MGGTTKGANGAPTKDAGDGKAEHGPSQADAPTVDFETVVERLAKMKEHESDRLEKCDAQLLGCRITTLHSAVRKKRAEWKAAEATDLQTDAPASAPRADDTCDGKAAPSQVKKLLDLAEHGIEFFHDRDKTGFARARENGRIIVAPVDSKDFKLVLRRRYYERYRSGPNDESMNVAIRTLEAQALFESEQCEVALRVAQHDGCAYLSLARDDGAIVEVSPSGWRLVDDSPVRFWRAPAMRALPLPIKGGSITALAKILNLASKNDFILSAAWLLGALTGGPYPIAAFVGEQGTAKSTSSRLLRKLVDPNKANLRSLPREERDLAVTSGNSHVLAFDNLSGLPAWVSDALARVATGGGFSCRELYTNNGESIFDGRRPIIMNGIEDFATRPDLLDRCILLRLNRIAESDRKTETEVDAQFEQEAPGILGALLDAVAYGLANPEKLETRPRMADFAEWIASCEGYFLGTKLHFEGEGESTWAAGDFEAAYEENRRDATEAVLNADSVAEALLSFMDSRTRWTGTATDLLSELAKLVEEDARRDREWPKNGRALGCRLRRLAPALRKSGTEIEHGKTSDKKRTRLLTLLRADEESPAQPPRTQTQADIFAPAVASDDNP
jgi:hypothetical protein